MEHSLKESQTELEAQHKSALRDYLERGGEAVLERAYELGRKAIAHHMSVLQMAVMHQQELVSVLLRARTPEGGASVVSKAEDFFRECLAPFDMTHRGYQEANETLRRMNEKLQRQAAELASANEKLKAEIAERMRAEAALQKAHDELETRVQERTAELRRTNEELVAEIIERKRAEERILLLNRLLQTISEINQLIVKERDRDRLLSEACRILVAQGGFPVAWIGMADFTTGEVRPVALAGVEAGFAKGVSVRCDDTPEGRGPTGAAIRTGRPVVCQDIAADGNLTPWRKAAARLGVSADAAFPIRVRGQVIGVIGIGATGAGILGDEMVALLDEMAGDIGYALQALDEVAVRKHAEEKLSESERRYRTLFEDSLEAMSLSVAGRFADVNSAWLKMHGFVDRDEVIGKDVLEVILLAQLPQLTRNKGFFHVFFGR